MNEYLEKYAQVRGRFDVFRLKLEPLLRDLLSANQIHYHLVESRTKTAESFSEKIVRSGKGYDDPVGQMPDMCGCRIITYYQDDVERISNIVKREFVVLEEELSHQKEAFEFDRVGYLSAHYIVKLDVDRSGLTEWLGCLDLHAEIQIRTVIQHAWSAVSHTLQYKQETRIPSQLQRRLYRISGLFELADEEFVGIRDQRAKLNEDAASIIRSGNSEVSLSSSTIYAFLKDWSRENDIMKFMSDENFLYDPDEADEELVADIYSIAKLNGILTIGQLHSVSNPPKFGEMRSFVKTASPRGVWTSSEAFILLLNTIFSFPEYINEKYLKENGWASEASDAIMSVISFQRASAARGSEPRHR